MKMKRIEATIQIDKTGAVSDAIKDLVGGFTVLEGNGRGSGERKTIRPSGCTPRPTQLPTGIIR